MQRISAFVLLTWVMLGSGPLAGPSSAADDKGTAVNLDGLKSQAPADWKEEAPTNRMRFMQFRLPKKGNDSDDGELVIFKGLGGSARDNIKRWKDQFAPPEGKTIDDVAKVEEIKIGDKPATYLDVQGTYLFKFPPFDPNAKTQRKPHYRMLAVHFEGPQNIYHIKLTGPAKTIEVYKSGFDGWLKNFK